jgi:hypothetical protein
VGLAIAAPASIESLKEKRKGNRVVMAEKEIPPQKTKGKPTAQPQVPPPSDPSSAEFERVIAVLRSILTDPKVASDVAKCLERAGSGLTSEDPDCRPRPVRPVLDPPGCRGSLRVRLIHPRTNWTEDQGQVEIYIIGPSGILVHRLSRGAQEAIFEDLPKGTTIGYIRAGGDLDLDGYEVSVPDMDAEARGSSANEKEKEKQTLREDGQFHAEILPPGRTSVDIFVSYQTRDLEVITYVERGEGTGLPAALPNVPVSILECGKVIVCRDTDPCGSVKYPVLGRGPWTVRTPSTLLLADGPCHLKIPGEIVVVAEGYRVPTTVRIVYSRDLASVYVPAPEELPESGQVQFTFCPVDEPASAQTAILEKTAPATFYGVNPGLHLFAILQTPEWEVEPDALQIELSRGQRLDLRRHFRLRARRDSSRLNQISGQVTDERGAALANWLIFLMLKDLQRILTSFTDSGGNFNFFTMHHPSDLAIQAFGYPPQRLGPLPQLPVASIATAVTSISEEEANWATPAMTIGPDL